MPGDSNSDDSMDPWPDTKGVNLHVRKGIMERLKVIHDYIVLKEIENFVFIKQIEVKGNGSEGNGRKFPTE